MTFFGTIEQALTHEFILTGNGPWWMFTFCNTANGFHQGLELGEVLNFIQSQGAEIKRVDRTDYAKEDVNPAGHYYSVLVYRPKLSASVDAVDPVVANNHEPSTRVKDL